jgi:hypothetical protein
MLLGCAAIAAVALLLFAQRTEVTARSKGIVGYSGNPATHDGAQCTRCHHDGQSPEVALDGPMQVEPGSTNAYTLTLTGGQQMGAGFNVSTTSGVLDAVDVDAQALEGEITHTAMKSVDPVTGAVTFSFAWTAGEGAELVTMYGAGNSVNGDGSTSGDSSSATSLEIAVGSAPGPTATEGATSTPTPTTMASDTPEVTDTPETSETPEATDTPQPMLRIFIPQAVNGNAGA